MAGRRSWIGERRTGDAVGNRRIVANARVEKGGGQSNGGVVHRGARQPVAWVMEMGMG